ncbi:MAG: C10 family peptidase [Muribaculaceae bacterium]|nr:C10 family peptidase [Muribaculaceae bacterium]
MKRFYLTIAAAVAGIGLCLATPLTPEQALSRLNISSLAKVRSMGTPALSLTVDGTDGQPAVYVFSVSDSKGYLILSADDIAMAQLGYSDSGSLDVNNLPPSLKYWLDEYANQISMARETQQVITPLEADNTDYAVIEPLLTTTWNQDRPYNDDCFLTLDDGSKMQCVTGCVATSMAQVMNYHKYPDVGRGSITYQPYSNVEPLSLDFSAEPFDWDNMLDSYDNGYTDAQAAAVAYLMKACGYSVQMGYSWDESGANSYLIMDSMYKYFKYNGRLVRREFYTPSAWAELIYNHLSEVGPVIYGGSGPGGGHSFVCDGYNGEGYFHFNWGWSGMGDGYYLLSALNPTYLGTGAGLGEYNSNQSIVLAVPSLETDMPAVLSQYGSLEGSMYNSNTIALMLTGDDKGWMYCGGGSTDFNFGLIVEDSKGNTRYLTTSLNDFPLEVTVVAYRLPIYADLSDAEMTTGETYKLTLASYRPGDDFSKWVPVVPTMGNYNYVNVVKTETGYEVLENEVLGLNLEAFYVLGNSGILKPLDMLVKMSNPAEFELTKSLDVYFITTDGARAYKVGGATITLNPGEVSTQVLSGTDWYTLNGYPIITEPTQFVVKLLDGDKGEFYDYDFPTVTLYPPYQAPEAMLPAWEVTPTPGLLEGYQLPCITVAWDNSTLVLLNAEDITVASPTHNIQGLETEVTDGVALTVNLPNDVVLDEQSTYTVTIPSNAVIVNTDGINLLNNAFAFEYITDKTTSLSSIFAEKSYTVYTLTGVKLLETENEADVRNLDNGFYIVNNRKVYLRNK